MNTNGSESPLNSGPPTEDTPAPDATQSEEPSSSGTTQKPAKKFPVVEIFGPVIQGEGSQAGQQTMFIRFGGCDYRCAKCDSLHAVVPQAIQKHATYMTAAEIHDALNLRRDETGVQWVTFSGGNPCMHKLDELVTALNSEDWLINVETQGTLWQDWLLDCTLITTSPKSMGMGEKFESEKFQRFVGRLAARRPLCVKVVVFSPQDFEMALHIKGIVHEVYTQGLGYAHEFLHGVSYYLSLGNPYPPVLDEDNNLVAEASLDYRDQVSTLLSSYRDLSEEVLGDPRLKDFRFLPQLHVLVYGNESER